MTSYVQNTGTSGLKGLCTGPTLEASTFATNFNFILKRSVCRAVADARFPGEGALTDYSAKFSWKLHENEENWSKISLCRSATVQLWNFTQLTKVSQVRIWKIIGFGLIISSFQRFNIFCRSSGFGFLSFIGRIAAILGNVAFGQLIGVSKAIPILITAAIMALGGILSFKLPESKNKLLWEMTRKTDMRGFT